MSDDDYYRRTYGMVKRLRQSGGGDLDELVLYCILYIGQTMPRCKQGLESAGEGVCYAGVPEVREEHKRRS